MKTIKFIIKSIYILFFLTTLFTSCIARKDCNITSISKREFDSEGLKGDFVFENLDGDIDTLALVNNIDILTDNSVKSIANYEECGHLIEFDYKLNAIEGTIEIRIEKKKNEQYFFNIGGFCIKKNFVLTKKEIYKDTLFIVKVEKCSYSEIKEIALRKFKIEYFITQNGDIWKPVKFIPKELKK